MPDSAPLAPRVLGCCCYVPPAPATQAAVERAMPAAGEWTVALLPLPQLATAVLGATESGREAGAPGRVRADGPLPHVAHCVWLE
ncbi:MAG: hypothetical protein KF774_17945 [Planctomyces sp.]|nr:hypothetical protein [Planctomyces sp.]